jgi:shikimate dehydrogenase
MHNAAFAATGLPHLYLRFRVPTRELRAAVREARALRFGGLNLTVPLKEAVLPFVDGLTPEAMRIGAANTLVFRDDGRHVIGDNTDGRGFVEAVRARVRLRGATAVLVGAGGSARAVGTALAAAGVGRLRIANRTQARAEALADRLAAQGMPLPATVPLAALADGTALEGAALVINTTPLGLAGGGLRMRVAASPRRCLFVDLVYAARPTPFVAEATRAGRAALDGSAMLLHQGALAFEAWTGRRAPRAVMARALAAAGLPLTRPRATSTVTARRPPTS